jgi:hypothetical protein
MSSEQNKAAGDEHEVVQAPASAVAPRSDRRASPGLVGRAAT